MGKPLISDAQMLAIHATMLRLQTLQRDSQPVRTRSTEAHATGRRPQRLVALLAGTLLQLRPSDTVLSDRADPLAEEVLLLAQEATFQPDHRAALLVAGSNTPAVAAGHVLAQQRSTRPGDDAAITVALLNGPSASLTAALELCSEALLPLLVIVQSGSAAGSPPIASLPFVEVVRVDAEDAVACCRVMQESLLRTRNRWGSVVLQAITLPGALDPVVAFEAHLRGRNLLSEGAA